MYISGNIMDFNSRMHELTTGQSDFNSYLTEGRGYTSGVGVQVSGKWEQQARKLIYSLTQSGVQLSTQQF